MKERRNLRNEKDEREKSERERERGDEKRERRKTRDREIEGERETDEQERGDESGRIESEKERIQERRGERESVGKRSERDGMEKLIGNNMHVDPKVDPKLRNYIQFLDSHRCVDFGIAEQHAVTFAAGLATEGRFNLEEPPDRERLKADSTNLASHLSQSCLMLTLEGFPFTIVNTEEYHSECSGNYHKDNTLDF
ncbi:reverse transcriptase domain-containing protein [Tanacetum coccineum]